MTSLAFFLAPLAPFAVKTHVDAGAAVAGLQSTSGDGRVVIFACTGAVPGSGGFHICLALLPLPAPFFVLLFALKFLNLGSHSFGFRLRLNQLSLELDIAIVRAAHGSTQDKCTDQE
jgi:hypothetical protein